ncbi:reverse transcriptase [Gossypium australe]|uniref:Reverse transcriptase n=1 Tax=Gossypium australe TaxID=47621 RepID=A0A5B6VGN0_9ROSI|nr:reverse transcriptase [Gossypium australe]
MTDRNENLKLERPSFAEVTFSPNGLLYGNKNQQEMEKVRRSCGFHYGIDVDSIGSRGGLSLAWRGDVNIMLQSFSNRHIDVITEDSGDRKKWRFTGGLPREERRMEAFRKVLEDCNLVDVGFSGNWFTWERGNLPKTNIQERLDRGVAMEECISLFPDSLIQHLPHSFSDHCPLLINIEYRARRLVHKNFKFESWWVLEEIFFEEVRCIWENSTRDLLSKLENMKKGLEGWASQIRRSRKKKKEVLTSKLTTLLESDRSDENLAELIDTKIHLNLKIEKDECKWE